MLPKGFYRRDPLSGRARKPIGAVARRGLEGDTDDYLFHGRIIAPNAFAEGDFQTTPAAVL